MFSVAKEAFSVLREGFSLAEEGYSLWNRLGAVENGVASDKEKEGFGREIEYFKGMKTIVLNEYLMKKILQR